MGCYINPPSSNKVSWLFEHGEEIKSPCAITESHVPVCLVNNGQFFAAGVAFDQREIDGFDQPTDLRPKQWFKVSREKLYTVSDLKNYE